MLDLLLSDALLITYPLLPVSILVFWDSRVDRMSTTSDVGEMKLTFLDLLSLPSLEICPFDLCRSSLCCQLGSDSRSAQGPGHHQGAAAVLVSPNLATTFSSHTWAKEKRKSRVWWERRSRRLVSWKERRHKKWKQEEGGEWFDQCCNRRRSLHLTAAPSAKAPCSHYHATTQGQFLQLHMHWYFRKTV